MKIDIKSPRANKKKIVIPFAGEENFIVEKKDDEYISVSNDDRYSNLRGGTITAPPTTGTQGMGTLATESSFPLESTTPILVVQPRTLDTPLQSGGSNLEAPLVYPSSNAPVSNPFDPNAVEIVNPPTPPPTDTCPSGQQSVNGVCKPIAGEGITNIPTFPNYSTMDCADLTSEISTLNFSINSGNLSLLVADAYNNALATAKNTYSSKCNAPSGGTSIALIPTTGGVIGGGFGGGGGGGFGEPPADETNITEQTTSTNEGGLSWFWIVAIMGGLYFLTKVNK